VKKRACFAEYLPCRIMDVGHRERYLHTCAAGLECRDRTVTHMESYCHRCGNDEDSGRPCALQSDRDHSMRYYHIHLLPNTPTPAEQAKLHASTNNNGGQPLPMCQYRASCDILRNPKDPRRAVHFARWSHPIVDNTPATGRAGAAAANGTSTSTMLPLSEPARYTLASTQCGNFPEACNIRDAAHLQKFRHPCPNQLMTADGSCPFKEETHYKNCIHACPNGYQCPLSL
jgi:hypothetical protein